MNYLELNQYLADTFQSIPLVEMTLDSSSKINDKDTRYWCIAWDLVQVTQYEGYRNYMFNIYAAERMDSAQKDIVAHYDKGMQILREGLIKLVESDEVSIYYPYTFECNSLKFADVLDVVMATVTLEVVDDELECLE